MYKIVGKRLLDLTICGVSFLVFFPLMILIGIGLLVTQGSIFFYQERPGKNEVPFFVIKFKTMNDKKDDDGNLLPNHQRITSFGNFLRRTSLDELPQLINVLRGDMSIIGPRPLLFKYIPLYNKRQRRRHEVRPGITGWAQVNGRNAISWTKKFEYDLYYVEHYSFILDLKILWMTIRKVLLREGVNAAETITMPPFNGNN